MRSVHESCDVTVITAAYNREKYLEQCVRSVQAQTLPPKEHIIVDDCSTDGTHAVATRLAEECARVPIRVLRLRQNSGAAAARNRAVEVATTGFVGVMDADDVAEPYWLSKVVPELERDASVGMAGGGGQFMDEDETELLINVSHPAWSDETPHARAGIFYGGLPGLVFRRSTFASAGGFNEQLRVGHDTDLIGRVVTVSRWVQVPYPVIRVRVVKGSLTGSGRGYQMAIQTLAIARTRLTNAGVPADRMRRELRRYERRIASEHHKLQTRAPGGDHSIRLAGLYLSMGYTRKARAAYAEAWNAGRRDLRCLVGLALSGCSPTLARGALGLKHRVKSALRPYRTTLRPEQFDAWLGAAQRSASSKDGTTGMP